MVFFSIAAIIFLTSMAVASALGKYKPGKFVTTVLFVSLLIGEVVYYLENYTVLGAQ